MSFRLEYLLVRKRHDDTKEKKRKRNEHAQDVGNKIKTNRENKYSSYISLETGRKKAIHAPRRAETRNVIKT